MDFDEEKIDVIYFMGQSNMSGRGGNPSLAPEVLPEAGEEFRAYADPTRLYPIEEPFGNTERNPEGLTEGTSTGKRGTLASAFINEYHELTGNKVIAVSISSGGKAMDLWLSDIFYNDVVCRMENVNKYLESEGITPNRTYIVWLQGESDEGRMVP